MSFGGGGGQADYKITYTIATRAEGSGQGVYAQTQKGIEGITNASTAATISQQKLKTAQEKVTQAGLGVSKAAKGMTFGILGMTTAGAEMIGMFSMWQSTQQAVAEAQAGVNEAIQEFGKDSIEAKKASTELGKANRWNGMVTRNLMLSMFDMLPFIVLTINGMLKLKTALAARAAATKELAMLNGTLARSEVGLAAAGKATGASMILQSNGMQAAAKSGLGFRGTLAAIGTAASGLLVKLAPLLAILAAIGIASAAYANNWLGLRSAFDSVGVAIGNAIPQLRGFLEAIAAVADKLGKGDIPGALDVLMKKASGVGPIETLQKKEEEAAKELEKIYEDLAQAKDQLFQDMMGLEDKKARKGFAEELGLKGDFGSDFAKKIKNTIQPAIKRLTDFGDLTTAFQSGLFDALDLRKKGFLDKLGSTWESRFEEIANDLDIDKSLFDPVIDVIKGSKGKTDQEIALAIANTMINNPEIAKVLEMYGIDLTPFENIINKAKLELEQWNATHAAGAQKVLDKLTGVDNVARQKKQDALKNQEYKVVNVDIKTTVNGGAATTYSKTGSPAATGFMSVIQTAIAPLFDQKNWASVTQTLGNPLFWIQIRTQANDWVKKHFPGTIIPGTESTPENTTRYNTFATNHIAPLFNQGIWQQGIVQLGNEVFWTGVTSYINSFITTKLSRLQGPNADSSGGNDMGQGQGFSNWIAFAKSHFAPIFNTGLWFQGLIAAANPQFWADITTMVNKNVTDSLSRLEATKNQPNSGGMNMGQGEGFSNWTKYATDMLAPIFDLKTWENALKPLMDGFKAFVDGIKGQQAEAVSSIVTEPEFDFMNDVPKAHAGMEFKNGKWVPQKKSGQGPHGQADLMTYPLKGEIVDIAYSSDFDPNTGITSHHGGPSTSTDTSTALEPVQLQGQIVNIIVPDTLGQSTIETTTAIFNLWNSLVSNVSKVWNALMSSMEQVELGFLTGTSEAFQGMHNLIISIFDSIAIVWSERGIGLIATAESAAQEIQDVLDQALENVAGTMNTFAKHWSKVCNSLINNAEAAADGINNALDSIEDEEVKITYKAVGSPSNPQAHGTSGMWVHKPTTFLAGEQGAEFVQVTRAHSKPSVTGGEGEGGGDITSTFNGTINLKISGNEIINPTKLSQKIKMTVGENMDRFG